MTRASLKALKTSVVSRLQSENFNILSGYVFACLVVKV
jgi:hypothetical protein